MLYPEFCKVAASCLTKFYEKKNSQLDSSGAAEYQIYHHTNSQVGKL